MYLCKCRKQHLKVTITHIYSLRKSFRLSTRQVHSYKKQKVFVFMHPKNLQAKTFVRWMDICDCNFYIHHFVYICIFYIGIICHGLEFYNMHMKICRYMYIYISVIFFFLVDTRSEVRLLLYWIILSHKWKGCFEMMQNLLFGILVHKH